MKLKTNKKVSGVYYKQPFTGKVVELQEGVRYNHKNNRVCVKIELENALAVYPGCVQRDYIYLVLDGDTLELDGNYILKE